MARYAFLIALGLALAAASPLAVRADTSVSGTWNCTATGEGASGTNTGKFPLTLTESNGSVTGSYYDGKASLAGTRDGITIKGQYKEPTGNGYFQFSIQDNGNSLIGSWGVQPDQKGGDWYCTR